MAIPSSKVASRYSGKQARTYDQVRNKQIRWHKENEIVAAMLADVRRGSRVLDVPVGTGRFFPLYDKLGFRVEGVDGSEDMLTEAGKKARRCTPTPVLSVGDATSLLYKAREFDASVCVRFLNLIDEESVRATMRELFRVTRSRIVLTIRLGDKAKGKFLATHDRGRFLGVVRRAGWRVAEEVPVFRQGWVVMRLERAP